MDVPEKIVVTRDPEVAFRADRIVLPGVGAFADCRRGLDALDGMIEAMTEAVRNKARPFFGICVGMQLMATRGVEHGNHDGFGWIAGEVIALEPVALKSSDRALKVPHMGWNDLAIDRPDHPVMRGVRPGDHAYFVHSYRFACADPAHEIAHADYGGPVTAVIGRDNLVGTQFHPEKSQAVGLSLIAAFLGWTP
jgi:imidazole glycerol-phosphate synthase subunit HisH